LPFSPLALDFGFDKEAGFDAFQAQHHLQRDRHIRCVGAGRGLVELGRDMLSSRFLAGLF
jgi:hypothetical protein